MKSSMSYESGVIEISDSSYLIVKESIMESNFAVQNGVVKASSQSIFTFVDSQFLENKAVKQNSVGLILNVLGESSFINCIFKDNSAKYIPSTYSESK